MLNRAAVEHNSLVAGLGLSALFTERVSGFVRWDANFGDHTEVHGVSAGVSVRF